MILQTKNGVLEKSSIIFILEATNICLLEDWKAVSLCLALTALNFLHNQYRGNLQVSTRKFASLPRLLTSSAPLPPHLSSHFITGIELLHFLSTYSTHEMHYWAFIILTVAKLSGLSSLNLLCTTSKPPVCNLSVSNSWPRQLLVYLGKGWRDG